MAPPGGGSFARDGGCAGLAASASHNIPRRRAMPTFRTGSKAEPIETTPGFVMRKPRLLIPLSIQFSVRYVLRTGLLRQIAEYASPIVMIGWEDAALRQELEADGAEVYSLPQARWGSRYAAIRAITTELYKLRLRSPSAAIDRRRCNVGRPVLDRMRKHLRESVYGLAMGVPMISSRVLRTESRLLIDDTNANEVLRTVEQSRVDAALSLTPFLRDEEMVMQCCTILGVPTCLSMLSFDNLTTRGRLPIHFDLYLVWNQFNRDEIRRGYPQASDKPVKIVGAPQFDFYWDRTYLWSENEWRRRLGLPDRRPVVLFAAGPPNIVPHEPQWLGHLDAGIEQGHIGDKAIILFRRHPNDHLDRWKEVLKRAKHVYCDLPWTDGNSVGKNNILRSDIERLASTLCYSRVHVSGSSTMTVDGAIFDRPQVGPAYDDSPNRLFDRTSRELYLREHYLPITDSHGLQIVHNGRGLAAAVSSGLREPGKFAQGRREIVHRICTFADGCCTQRVAESLRDFVSGAACQVKSFSQIGIG